MSEENKIRYSVIVGHNGKAYIGVNLEESDEYISNAFWVKDRATKERITFLPYKEKDINRAYVLIKFKAEAIGKKATIRIYEYDKVSFSEKVNEYSFNIKYLSTCYFFNLHGGMFEKGEEGEETASFFFEIKIGDSDYQEYCNSSSERLKVHKIIYIPEIMKDKGWQKGYLLQKKWFEGKSSNTPETKADINNIVSMDWVLKFSRAKKIYDKMISDKIWVNTAGKKELVNELKKMIKNKELNLPKDSREVNFGTFSLEKTQNPKGEVAPKIDYYHYQERALKEKLPINDDRLDDLFAALGDFVFRMAVKGTIKRIKNTFEISIKEVGVYIRDSFDFNDVWYKPSQLLGCWSVSKNDISTSSKGDSYTLIQNSNYQDYREDSGYGMDFLVYSDVKTTIVNDKFTISNKQL